MSNPTVLVTGASGHLGRRVLELVLAAPGARTVIATTRNPERLADLAARGVVVRAADFDDEASLATAFAGADHALLISTDALDRPGRRLAQHQAALRAFAAAGVTHVVYTSAPDAPSVGAITADHKATEAALAGSGLDHTILRNNLYAEVLLGSLPAAVASGVLADARGTGATAWVTRDDCARIAAAAVLDPRPGRHIVDVGGPALLTSADIARIVSEVAGKPVVHQSISVDALIAGLVGHGLPEPVAHAYAGFDTAIARGELAVASDAIARLTGTPPQSLAAFLTAHRAALGNAAA